jgi:hypothetical protein
LQTGRIPPSSDKVLRKEKFASEIFYPENQPSYVAVQNRNSQISAIPVKSKSDQHVQDRTNSSTLKADFGVGAGSI